MLLGEPFPEPEAPLQEVLSKHPMLAGLNEKDLARMCKIASHVSLNVGEALTGESQQDHLYLIQQGQVDVEIFVPGRGRVSIQTLNPGDAMGWAGILESKACRCNARVITAAKLIAFRACDLQSVVSKHAGLGYFLARRVGQLVLRQLQATEKRLVEFYTEAD